MEDTGFPALRLWMCSQCTVNLAHGKQEVGVCGRGMKYGKNLYSKFRPLGSHLGNAPRRSFSVTEEQTSVSWNEKRREMDWQEDLWNINLNRLQKIEYIISFAFALTWYINLRPAINRDWCSSSWMWHLWYTRNAVTFLLTFYHGFQWHWVADLEYSKSFLIWLDLFLLSICAGKINKMYVRLPWIVNSAWFALGSTRNPLW